MHAFGQWGQMPETLADKLSQSLLMGKGSGQVPGQGGVGISLIYRIGRQ